MKIRLKSISRCGLWLSVLSVTMGVEATRCFAQACKAPTPQKQAE